MAATRRPPRPATPGRLGLTPPRIRIAALPDRLGRTTLAPALPGRLGRTLLAIGVAAMALGAAGCGGPGGPAGGPVAPREAAPGPPSPPVRLAIPSIAVVTTLVRLGRERDGSMQAPADFARAGWFAEGPPPGAVGPAVIAGHVDSRTGPAVFFRLRELRQGDPVEVERADGTRLVFVVEQARSYPKAAFPPRRCSARRPGPPCAW